MTPIEAIAKALDDYAETLPEQSEFRAFLRSHKHGAARAALLALADAELPEKMIEPCKDDLHDGIDEIGHIVETSSLATAFRAMLRAIAND